VGRADRYTGRRLERRGVAVAPAVGAWTPRAHGAREGRVRGFLGGALRCLADSESPSPKKKRLASLAI
jgi:hypothetical protein